MVSDNRQQLSRSDEWVTLATCVLIGGLLAALKADEWSLETLFVLLVVFPASLYALAKGAIGLFRALAADESVREAIGWVSETVGCLAMGLLLLVGGALVLLVFVAVVKWSFGVVF